MSEFTNFDPKNTLIPIPFATEVLGRDHWIVSKGFEFYIGDKKDNRYVYIPKGYLTDGATVPKRLQVFVPTWGKYGAATIVHDYLCEELSVKHKGVNEDISRARSDYIFLQAMKVLEVPWYRRIPMYLAVRGYSIIVARNKKSPWRTKRDLEIRLELHFDEYGDYNYPRSN